MKTKLLTALLSLGLSCAVIADTNDDLLLANLQYQDTGTIEANVTNFADEVAFDEVHCIVSVPRMDVHGNLFYDDLIEPAYAKVINERLGFQCLYQGNLRPNVRYDVSFSFTNWKYDTISYTPTFTLTAVN